MTGLFFAKQSQRCCQKAWTLLELLFVTGIIIVLLVIAVPVSSRIAAQSKGVACVARLKTIGSAVLVYASDHQQALPGPQGEWIQLNTNLPKQLGPYLGYTSARSNDQTDLWECPGNSHVIRRNESPAYPVKMAGYLTHPPLFGLYNYPTAGTTTRPMTLLKLQELYEPEERWLFRDIDHMAYPVTNDAAIGGRYGPVHNGGRNVYYAEGHVRWVKSVKGVRP